MALNDQWSKYTKDVQDKLKNSAIIQDAVRNCRERGHDKSYAQRITGAPFEVVDKIYNEKQKHDTARKHSPDD